VDGGKGKQLADEGNEYVELQKSTVRDGDYIHTPYISGTYYKGGRSIYVGII
jgi:hypothetical protein